MDVVVVLIGAAVIGGALGWRVAQSGRRAGWPLPMIYAATMAIGLPVSLVWPWVVLP